MDVRQNCHRHLITRLFCELIIVIPYNIDPILKVFQDFVTYYFVVNLIDFYLILSNLDNILEVLMVNG